VNSTAGGGGAVSTVGSGAAAAAGRATARTCLVFVGGRGSGATEGITIGGALRSTGRGDGWVAGSPSMPAGMGHPALPAGAVAAGGFGLGCAGSAGAVRDWASATREVVAALR
jgi:hypothetical protein